MKDFEDLKLERVDGQYMGSLLWNFTFLVKSHFPDYAL